MSHGDGKGEREASSSESLGGRVVGAERTFQGPRDPQDRSVGSTLSYGPLAGEGRPDPMAFPVPGWDRYTSVRFLGKGGMGKVFLVHDPRLRRDVALKFVRGDNPEHVRRLIGEARNQARVSHGRVCKVHEVGEVEGKVYIAMQYIDGQPLGALAGELTLAQKVRVVRDAAEGIHEAHRAGIVHRDLKPSNIMVERGDDGELRPYVMDFGLARSALDDGTTQSGAVLGTPRYMAPEQARGATSTLDRRADVYSLGATLYHLVTGQPPVDGATVMEVMHNLEHAEPRRPRALNADLAADLEAIILKCLERDRTARYDSARALADDLDRFLNGESVQARSAGTWYRLRKRLAKHRRVVAITAAALALSLGAIGWGVRAGGEAAERERLAGRFTEMVGGIVSSARNVALSPRHDLHLDRAMIQVRMVALDVEIARAGASAAGHGHYALGCGYLALGDEGRARDELEWAWRHGFREPRAAYQLAVVMGRLYHQQLIAVRRVPAELREAKQREIERELRDPALAYLQASTGAEAPSPAYAAAMMAFYRGRSAEALERLDGIDVGVPYFYEASELRGDILLARAFQLRDDGKPDEAMDAFSASRVAYGAAAAIGESVPSVYRSLAALEYAVLAIEIYAGAEVEATFARGTAATTAVLAMLPDDSAALVLEASFYRSLAEHGATRGREVEDLLRRALADAERAGQGAPARQEVAEIYRQWGEVRQGRNVDPSVQLGKAIAVREATPPADRDARFHATRALIFKTWADYEDQVGADAQRHRAQANEAYRDALVLAPKLSDVWGNLAINHYMRAKGQGAKDPDGDLAAALGALDQATSLNPKNWILCFYRGEIHLLIAQRALGRGGDPTQALGQALAAYQQGVALDDTSPHLRNAIGGAALTQAKVDWDAGRDPGAALAQADAAFAQAIKLAPDQGFGYDNTGVAATLRGWLANARGVDPRAQIGVAVASLNEAIRRDPDNAGFWSDLAAAHTLLASYELEHGRDPQASLAAASAAARTAQAKNPRDVVAQGVLAQTLAVRARFAATRGAPGDFESAVTAYQGAIALAPDNVDYQLDLARLCLHWATALRDRRTDPQSVVARGLAVAAPLLAIRPSWPDALVVRGSLRLVEAQTAKDTETRRALATQAAADLDQAFARNRDLPAVWGDRVLAAHALSARR